MKNIFLNKHALAGLVTAFLVMGCYDKFDADSYKPVFTIGGFSAADEIQPDGLVAYWGFEDNLADTKSGDEASGKETTFANGFKGRALSLNVANKSYATFEPGSAITGLGSFTISLWVNPDFVDNNGDNGIDGIIGFVNLSNPTGFWGNLDWFIENGSNPEAAKLVFHVVSEGGETWINVNNYKGLFGAWTNHTVTYDESTSTFRYFINGATATTATAGWTGPIEFVGSGPMVFGAVQFQTDPSIGCCGNQSWASYMTGLMDEVRIYNKALTAEEVNALVVLQGKGK